jgi:pyruvate carboxylase
MYLITRGIRPQDVPNLTPGSHDFPESVIDMLSGGLGQPDGGWPKDVQKVVLGDRVPTTKRPGELAAPLDLEATRAAVAAKLGRPANDDDLYSHLMYPQVFADFDQFLANYGDVSGLPTPAFFYGLSIGEEIEVQIDHGKLLFIKLIGIGEADDEGRRNVFYELNGMPRESQVLDKSLAPKNAVTKPKGDSKDPLQVVAPMPGMVTDLAVGVGTKVKAGDPIITLEAMKMLTTISANTDGTVTEILVKKGDAVSTEDLLARLEA